MIRGFSILERTRNILFILVDIRSSLLCFTDSEAFANYPGQVECPNSLHQEIGSLQGAPETQLMVTNDSKMTIAVVVSIILVIFCAAGMFILYRKYKTTNKDYDLEIFYSATTPSNNYENQNYSNNPMDSVSAPD